MTEDKSIWSKEIHRRRLLRLGAGALAGAIGGWGINRVLMMPHHHFKKATAKSITPGAEIGPFFVDDKDPAYNRGNILANLDGSGEQKGIPLLLKIYVRDAKNNFAPMKGAQLDIWQGNALGLYSLEPSNNSATQTWLRGYQLTNVEGMVSFQTIIPSGNTGKAAHIHLRVRSKYGATNDAHDSSNTTQFYFPQDTIDSIYDNVTPYNSISPDYRRNADDTVYAQQTNGGTELVLEGDYTTGYTSTYILNMPFGRYKT